MWSRVAAAVGLTGAVMSTGALTSGAAASPNPDPTPSTVPSTTSTSTSTTSTSTTTSTTDPAPPGPSANKSEPVAAAAAAANPDAYYGNPKLGVEIATATPGLYPVFGTDNQPDLSGFSVEASPASGQPTLSGVTEPQPACSPNTSLSADPAPNLYCETDTDSDFEFPMASDPESYDFSMAATPVSYVHDPDQSYPQELSEGACLGASQGSDDCEIEGFGTPSLSDVTYFDYIGIYRELEVTTETTSGTLLPGVTVSLSCSATASDPTYACPQPGELDNLNDGSGGSGGSVQRANVSTSTTSTTTGSNGTGSFSGIYLPGTTVSLSAAPPAGYQAASLVATVASPVTSSTTTGAAISQAAQTPIDLTLVFSAQAATTTTTTVAPTTTTVPVAAAAAPTGSTPSATPPSALALTGFDGERAFGAGAILLVAGAGLLLGGRRRRGRRGAHVARR